MGNRSRQNQKSAKDKAFERERIKLQSIIHKQSEEIVALKREISTRDFKIETLEHTISVLESYIGVPKEDLLADMERKKKIESLMSIARYINL